MGSTKTPIVIPLYTVLLYCVIMARMHVRGTFVDSRRFVLRLRSVRCLRSVRIAAFRARIDTPTILSAITAVPTLYVHPRDLSA